MYVAGEKNGYAIEVCGRVIDENKSPETSVIRETRGETGLAISQVLQVRTVFLSPGLIKEQVHLYVAAYKNEDKIGSGGV